ncbi:MAG TPA: hypothetical protein VF821_00155 [Lentzea sp.]
MTYLDYDLDPTFTEADSGLIPKLVVLDVWIAMLLSGKVGDPNNPMMDWPLDGGPMQGVSHQDFYRVPSLLSGQSLDDIGAIYEALIRNGRGLDDGMEGFQSACDNTFRNWTGEAQAACARYGGDVMSYINDERDVITGLAGAVLAHGAIIKSAREDWLKLVDQFLDALGKKMEDDEASGLKVLWTAVGAVVGAALTIATAGIGAAAGTVTAGMFIGATANVIATVGAEMAKEAIGGETFREIGESFLRLSREMEQRLTSAFDSEVAEKLRQLTEERVAPPPSPLDLGKFDQNPKKQFAPEHSTPAVDRWLKKKEERANHQPPSNLSARLGG